MIKVLFKTAVVSAIILLCVDIHASEREESVAAWESAADGKLWSSLVVSETFSNTGNTIPLNSFCGADAFEAIKYLRYKAVSALRARLESGGVTTSTEIYAGILKNISETGTTPLNGYERGLLRSVNAAEFSFSTGGLLTDGNSGEDEITFAAASAAVSRPGNSNFKVKSKHAPADSLTEVRDISGNVNLNDYSLRSARVDMYNLYLYIWEDNPFGDGNIYMAPSSLFSFPRNIITTARKTEHKHQSYIYLFSTTRFPKGVLSC